MQWRGSRPNLSPPPPHSAACYVAVPFEIPAAKSKTRQLDEPQEQKDTTERANLLWMNDLI
jgi:hypothetical protein